MSHRGPVEGASLPRPSPLAPSSSLYLHLHFFPSCSLPLPPSFLYAMAHTNHFICSLLDFPDAARLQPPSCADPAFYFAHTERNSGIKWPPVSADVLFFYFYHRLGMIYQSGATCAQASAAAQPPPPPPAHMELRGHTG